MSFKTASSLSKLNPVWINSKLNPVWIKLSEDIFSSFEKGEINSFKIPPIEQNTMEILVLTIDKLIKKMKTGEKNFKNMKFYSLIDFIINTILKHEKGSELFKFTKNILISIINKTSKGHIFLNKLKKLIDEEKYELSKNKLDLLENSSMIGTLPIFIFWKNFFNVDILSDEYISVFAKSISNSDDRTFLWFLDEIKSKNKETFFHKSTTVEYILKQILTSSIPLKFKLKRIRILSENCNLIPYFNKMFDDVNPEIFIELMKYYYKKPLTFQEIKLLFHNIRFYTSTVENLEIEMKKIHSNLLTEKEKKFFAIFSLLHYKRCFFDFTKLGDLDKESFNEIKNDTEIFNLIFHYLSKDKYNCFCQKNCMMKIVSYFGKSGYFHNRKFLNNFNSGGMNEKFQTLTKFYITKNANEIKINRVLSFLRVIAKKKSKNYIINCQVKLLPVMHELLNFKPIDKPIMKNGSVNWQNKMNKFTIVPPRHLLPYEFQIYNNFLLREKADGIQTNNLPISILPKFEEIILRQVKAEYLEDLDLYLIFDIDIPNTNILERYELLRKNHPATKNTEIKTINSIKDLKNYIEEERIILNNFLKESKDYKIKWYPKVSFLVNNDSENIKNEIINEIIINQDSDLNKFINEIGPFGCDGLIISPLSGNSVRDIKIKPKNLMTIDLQYDGTNFLDYNKNKYNNIIKNRNISKNIYRCYPVFKKGEENKEDKLFFEPRDVRYDKKNPNNADIINSITNIINFDWKQNNIIDKPYYHLTKPVKKISTKIKAELEEQTQILVNQIEKLEPENGKNWLDLGCGKVKLLYKIKKYNPKKYVGLDVDPNILLDKIHIMDEEDNIKISPCDLRKNWLEDSKWYSIKNMKFDYVIINFSMMYLFDSDTFWNELMNVSNSNTKILFNIVSEDIKEKEFKLEDAYMKFNQNKINYFFPWCHTKETEEIFISNEEVENKLKEKNLKIIDTFKSKNLTLSTFYKWFQVKIN